jgi:hypothetical protein
MCAFREEVGMSGPVSGIGDGRLPPVRADAETLNSAGQPQ